MNPEYTAPPRTEDPPDRPLPWVLVLGVDLVVVALVAAVVVLLLVLRT